MPSPREAIIKRLVEVMEGVPSIRKVYRNNPQPSEALLPAAVVFEADEETDAPPDQDRHRSGARPFIVTMRPEIWLWVSSGPATVGTELNAIRDDAIKAILSDPQIDTLAGVNGRVRYESSRSALAAGRAMEGQYVMTFAISYVLKASEI